MRTVPYYIENTGIQGAELDFRWRGPQAHLGPMETVNRMFDLISSKTTCGILTEAAGIIEWGAWRLEGHTDVTVLLHMVEASFAFQVHPAYVDRDGADTWEPEEEPAAESAAAKLQELLWKGLNQRKWWRSYYQPIDSAFHSAYLVRYIMPKPAKKPFSSWLEGMVERVRQVAPKPAEDPIEGPSDLSDDEIDAYYARHWGEALPPQILDPDFDYNHAEREELVDRFLRELDWQANPFLRSPEVMKGLGFEGTPYRLI